MIIPRQLIFKLLSKCNIACVYCYQETLNEGNWKSKFKVMPPEVFEKCLSAAIELQNGRRLDIYINLHGGEPLMVGINTFLQYLTICNKMQQQYGIKIHISTQTNGLLLDENWLDLLKKYNVKIGVSLDGPPEYNDRYRIYANGKGTAHIIEEKIKLIQNKGLKVNTITVANAEFSGRKVLKYFSSIGVNSTHVLLPAENHETLKCRSKPFYGNYLISMFDEWLSGENNVEISDFENVIKSISGFEYDSWILNAKPSAWICFLPDGSVEKGDPYGICDSGQFSYTSVRTAIIKAMKTEAFRNHISPPGIAEECNSCEFHSSCGAGYPSFRFSKDNGYNDKSVFCEDTIYFYRHVSKYIQKAQKNLPKNDIYDKRKFKNF